MKKYFIIIIAIVVVFTTIIFNYHQYSRSTTKLDYTLANINVNDDTVIVDDLKHSYNNDEIVGLLEIPNTTYKSIITQSSDNNKYLNHDEYGKKNRIGNPFLDYRVNINTSKKLLIYAHNSRYVEMPFKILENYYDKDYFEEHKYIKIITDEIEKTYQIFSVYVETSDWSYMKLDFDSDEDWIKHLDYLKNNSMYDTEVDVSEDDEILILQTCSTKKEYRNYKKKFLLVISRRVS